MIFIKRLLPVSIVAVLIASCAPPQTTTPPVAPGRGFAPPADPYAAIAAVASKASARSLKNAKDLYARMFPGQAFTARNVANSIESTGGTMSALAALPAADRTLVRELEWAEPDVAASLRQLIQQKRAADAALNGNNTGSAGAPQSGLGDFFGGLFGSVGKKTDRQPLPTNDGTNWQSEMPKSNPNGQGACGSCWSFAVCRTIEANYHRKYGKWIDLSEQDLLTNPFRGGSGDNKPCCCIGEWFDPPLKYILNNGIPTEQVDPYKMIMVGKGECHTSPFCQWRGAQKTPGIIKNYGMVNSKRLVPTVEELKAALVARGPLIVAFDCPFDLANYPKGYPSDGVIRQDNANHPAAGGHAVVLVGWSEKKQAWLFFNQWGKWGNNGYGWMAFNAYRFGQYATWVDVGPPLN